MKTKQSDPDFPINQAVWLVPWPVAIAFLAWFPFNRGIPWIVGYAAAVLIVVIGALKLFRAKLPLYRQKRFLTWGPRGLPEAAVLLYWRAIRLLLVGMSAAVFLLLPKLTGGF
ncbi:MAG: hypothetical protein JWO89_436 [Verrucomicrobiaceae bacterium]|nr:hypothetical protein [Verrucomicrobiaceae bacterium]